MLRIMTQRSEETLEELLFEDIKEKLADLRSREDGPSQILLIVPAQYTLAAEQRAFECLDGPGFFDFHIMSGNKLIHQILHETGGPGLTPVNTIGRSMILRRTAKDRSQDFRCYSQVLESNEFLKMAADFIVQAKQNGVDAEGLEEMIRTSPSDSMLRDKLQDMQILMTGYSQAMAGKFSDSEDLLKFASGNVPASVFVKNSLIYYYGFYSFTSNELEFMAQLASCSRGLTVMLQSAGDAEAAGGYAADEADEAVFSAPEKAKARLTAVCAEHGIKCEVIRGKDTRRVQGDPEVKTTPGMPEMHLVSCASPFTQAETIAAAAAQLIRTGRCTPDRIAVLCADTAADGSVLQRVFEAFGLPVFMDNKRTVAHDPAAGFVSALLDAAADGYSRDSLLSLIKNPFLPEALKNPDLPKYMELYHIEGRNLPKPLKYGSGRYTEEQFSAMEEARKGLWELLEPFRTALEEAETAENKCRVLYNFLDESLGYTDALSMEASRLSEEGLLDASEEIFQFWGVLGGLLDQIVELLGQEKMTTDEFREILSSSLSDIEIGVLPQSEGKIQIGTVSRSKIPGIKALFIAGFNEGRIPAGAGGDTILNEKEQAELLNAGFTVYKPNALLDAENRLLVHNALNRDVEYLWLGWTSSDASGAEQKPSPVLLEFAEEHGLKAERDIENGGDALGFLQGTAAASGRLASEMRAALDSRDGLEGMDPVLKASYDILKDDGRTAAIREALSYTSSRKDLKKETAEGLYKPQGKDLSLSPSRLENFSACPFKHFVRYGLYPEEDREFAIDALTIGNIHHEALLELSDRLSAPSREKNQPISAPDSLWSTVTDEQLQQMLDEILDGLAENGFDGILRAGDRESYRADRIRRICMDFARRLVQQVRQGNIDSMYFETGFGRGRVFPAIDIPTRLGTVHVEGRIDRVDMIKTEDGSYVKVVDYKSGAKKFDRRQVEKGLALQLMCYLEGTLGRKGLKPAGMFYYLIKEPRTEADYADLRADEISEKLAEKLEKEYMLSGMFVDNEKVLESIDRRITDTGNSSIIRYRTAKTTGNVTAPDMVSEEDFDGFRKQFRETLGKLCSDLAAGKISPSPKPYGSQQDSCTFCDYQAVCLYKADR